MNSSDDWYQRGYEQGQQDEQDRIIRILETFIEFVRTTQS